MFTYWREFKGTKQNLLKLQDFTCSNYIVSINADFVYIVCQHRTVVLSKCFDKSFELKALKCSLIWASVGT